MARTHFLALALLLASHLSAQIELTPPGQREFVLDHAGVLGDADVLAIRESCDKLLTEKATPIVVVVIESMAAHGGHGMSIEGFATALFNQWGIGHPTLHGKPWNTGILLLVSIGDRRARIELGAGWDRRYDAQARQIMDNLILPGFRRGDYAIGIRDGVRGLDAMARELSLPGPSLTWQAWLMIAAFLGLMAFTAVSLVRRGAGGWAWLFWGVVFSVLGMFLMGMLRSRGGRGFGGGSFGGGFSGGGGATGSW